MVHRSEVERDRAALTATATAELVIADTREQVAALNAAIRDRRLTTGARADAPDGRHHRRRRDRSASETGSPPAATTATSASPTATAGPSPASRRRQLVSTDGSGDRTLPADYVHEHVELAYATTVHGAQGETVDRAHLLIGETTGAAAAYVGMTRGRESNTAHLVADSVDDARAQWIEVFNRDRADLGPAHAARVAADDIERYGPGPTASPRRRAAAAACSPPRSADPARGARSEPIPGPRPSLDRGIGTASGRSRARPDRYRRMSDPRSLLLFPP